MRESVVIFTPETAADPLEARDSTTGFILSQKARAMKLEIGAKLACYMVGMKCWFGMLEVTGTPFVSDDPKYGKYQVRVPVKELVWVNPLRGLQVDSPAGKEASRKIANTQFWQLVFQAPLRELLEGDAERILAYLLNVQRNDHDAAFDPVAVLKLAKERKLPSAPALGQLADTAISEATAELAAVVLPKLDSPELPADAAAGKVAYETRESHCIQGMLAEIGLALGCEVYVPAADRKRVAATMKEATRDSLLHELPEIGGNPTTKRIYKEIDVLWIRHGSPTHAFEVEHTTAIYSGILRMSDLAASQNHISTRLFIVADEVRRLEVIRQFARPTFNLANPPLTARCRYIAYEKVRKLHSSEYLSAVHLDRVEAILAEWLEAAVKTELASTC